MALPWSAVRDTMWAGRFGSVPLRYVACRCPKCKTRNRVIVREGGGSPGIIEARRTYGGMSTRLFNPSDRETPVWSTGEDGTGPGRLAQCGACMTRWSISMHANGPFSPRDVPTPSPTTGPNTTGQRSQMIDQLSALGHALARLGYTFHDDGARLVVDAPEGSTAAVSSAPPAYRCTFTLHADIRASVAEAWPGVVGLEVREPVAVHEQLPAPAPVPREPVFEHAYAIGPPVDAAFALAQDEAQRGRFRIATSWEYMRAPYVWDGSLTERDAGPTIHWSDWGRDTAWLAGAAKGWAKVGRELSRDDRAARPVETILLRAAEGEALPSGIIALDLRGLPAGIVFALVGALVTRVRSSKHPRGVICLCDEHAALWVARDVDLDCAA